MEPVLKNNITDTIELLKYEISVDGRGIIEGGRVREQVVVGTKNLNVRKAYAPNGIYRIGWVYDYDVSYCMLCMSEFGWFMRRHHCRACGFVVCGYCSPYKAKISGLPEVESRVCRKCYMGDTVAPNGRFSPTSSFNASFDLDLAPSAPAGSTHEASPADNLFASPIENDLTAPKVTAERKRHVEKDNFERSQARNYVHSYR